MRSSTTDSPYVTTRPLDVAFRYFGPLFDGSAASATMASEIIAATPLFCEAVGRFIAPDPGHVHPRIVRIANGSWEIMLQFAVQAFEEVKSFGNMPYVSALANIGGSTALIFSAIKICTKMRNMTPIQSNSDGTVSFTADGEKTVAPKAALELALDPKFRMGLEAMLAFQLLRPGIDGIDVRIGNEYMTVNKDDFSRIIEKPPQVREYQGDVKVTGNAKIRSEKPQIIRLTEEKVLRFESPSQRGKWLIFTDCYREPKLYRLGMVASRQIRNEFGGNLYRGRFYNCLVENGIQQYRVSMRYLTIDALQFIGPDIPKTLAEIYTPDESVLMEPNLKHPVAPTNTSRLTPEERKRRDEALHRALSAAPSTSPDV
jgi:hypothetical protein